MAVEPSGQLVVTVTLLDAESAYMWTTSGRCGTIRSDKHPISEGKTEMDEQDAARFEYEGHVILSCQEGGYAAPTITLADLMGGTPQGVTAKVRALSGEAQAKTLDEVLAEQFGPTEHLNDFGDEAVGRLRITVQRIS